MIKKRIILICTAFLLAIIPISTVEIPHEVYADQNVLGPTAVLAVANTTAKQVTVKKPVVKKKVVAKKKVVKKKERLITAPPLITVDTAPHSAKPIAKKRTTKKN